MRHPVTGGQPRHQVPRLALMGQPEAIAGAGPSGTSLRRNHQHIRIPLRRGESSGGQLFGKCFVVVRHRSSSLAHQNQPGAMFGAPLPTTNSHSAARTAAKASAPYNSQPLERGSTGRSRTNTSAATVPKTKPPTAKHSGHAPLSRPPAPPTARQPGRWACPCRHWGPTVSARDGSAPTPRLCGRAGRC